MENTYLEKALKSAKSDRASAGRKAYDWLILTFLIKLSPNRVYDLVQ